MHVEAPEDAPTSGGTAGAHFPDQVGLRALRGAEVVQVSDEEGHIFTGESENDQPLRGPMRKIELRLDPAQYHLGERACARAPARPDECTLHRRRLAQTPVTAPRLRDANPPTGSRGDIYQSLNVVLRRKPKENNFKAILECIRELLTTPLATPSWIHDVLLGYGDPAAAAYWTLPEDQRVSQFDFYDTFLDLDHVRESFPGCDVQLATPNAAHEPSPQPPYRLTIPKEVPRGGGESNASSPRPVVTVEPYQPRPAGPYPEDEPRRNPVRFTRMQVEALRAAMSPGLTLVVGPPGTGKTDTAVQMVSNIVHTFPRQRTLIITHSNQALNDIFEKLLLRDVDERHLLRLGHGEELLETEKDFSRRGRVNYMLQRRLELLVKVEALGKCLNVPADVGYTCETAGYFFGATVEPKWREFHATMAREKGDDAVQRFFPFADFFTDTPEPLFMANAGREVHLAAAEGAWRHLCAIFEELGECRAFELLRSSYDRGNFLLTKHAKVVAMTCTHAAIKRKDLVALAFQVSESTDGHRS
eukprot:scaffold123404_cov23-Tisochrysis_lutea.AAC.1